MWIEITEKLVDRCIQLLTVRSANKKRLFEEHITPIFHDFEAVHAKYLETFAKLRSEIMQGTMDLKELINYIEAEYLFSEGQRNKLRKIAYGQGLTLKYEPELINTFLFKIHSYLTVPYAEGSERPQRWLGGMMSYIELLSDFCDARRAWEHLTMDEKVWKVEAENWGNGKQEELRSLVNHLQDVWGPEQWNKEREQWFNNRAVKWHAKKQLYLSPQVVQNYIQSVDAGRDFSEHDIAGKYLNNSVENMQTWYGEVGEAYWKIKSGIS